ncbi:MAG: hypothetical protein VYE40_18670 [Myxococcota bacterium]|nr:hypothetical protein [Myxococcota bacterium]MEC9443119.1 hypothetical protein [Myxococcota bacterium]
MLVRPPRQRLGARMIACLLAASCVLAPVTSFGQDDGNAEQMQEYVKKATQHFRDKEYSKAGDAFMMAYQAKAEPVLLKNAMVAYYTADDCPSAVKTGFSFLDTQKGVDTSDMSADQKVQYDKDIRDTKTVISKCRLAEAELALKREDTVTAKAAIEGIGDFVSGQDDIDRLFSVRKQIEEMEKAQSSNGNGNGNNNGNGNGNNNGNDGEKSGISNQALVGWVLVGAGAAGGAVTLVTSLNTANEINSFEKDYGDRIEGGPMGEPIEGNAEKLAFVESDCDRLQKEPGGAAADVSDKNECKAVLQSSEKINRRIIIGSSISGAAVIAGVTLLVLDERNQRKAEAAKKNGEETSSLRDNLIIAPSFGRDSAGATVLFRF